MIPKISVIVPIYGVEKFIGRAAESMMMQTLDDVEFIFVDDCTKDCSIKVLEDVIARFPERKKQVRILHHTVNKGLPAARNTGLGEARGEYIFHWDSDDFAEPEMLERLYCEAKEKDADYVWCDWFLCYDSTDRTMRQPSTESKQEALCMMLSGKMKYNVWNKLVRREVYELNGIRFPEGHSMGEDMTMIKLLVKCVRPMHLRHAFYHYVKTNSNAMTVNLSDKALDDIRCNVGEIEEFLKDVHVDDVGVLMGKFKLATKYPFLYSTSIADYKRWEMLWPESNKFISKDDGLRPWLVQFLAKNKQWMLLKLHYNLYNFIYRRLWAK